MFDDDDDFYGSEDNFDNYDGGFDHDNLDDCYYRDPEDLLNDFNGMDDFNPDILEDDHDRYYHQPPVDFHSQDSYSDPSNSMFHSLMPFFLLSLLSRNQEGSENTYLTKEDFGMICLGFFAVVLIVVALVLICM